MIIMSSVTCLLVAVATFLLCFFSFLHLTWLLWKRRYNFLPDAPNVPWLGSIPYLGSTTRDFTVTIRQWYKKYDNFFMYWVGPIPVICVARPDLVEGFLKSAKTNEKDIFYGPLRALLGDGLILSEGKKWKQRRAAITPTFHFSILKDFSEIFEIHAQQLVEVLMKSGGGGVDVQRLTSLSTLDVICATSMGVELNALHSSSDCDYVTNLNMAKDLMLLRMLNPISMASDFYYKLTANGKAFCKSRDVLRQFAVKVINERIQKRKEFSSGGSSGGDDGGGNSGGDVTDKKRRVLLDTLLDMYEEGSIDIEGIQEEIDTFISAGHDTTSAALSWCLYEIGRRPDIQEVLYVEIQTTDTTQQDATITEKLTQLKHLDLVIKECMRIHTPVPVFGRKVTADVEICGHVIPVGTQAEISVSALHNNEEVWERAEEFRPERFASEEFAKRHPYSYIPFSAGARNCVGQKFAMLEVKTYLYYILKSCVFESVQDYEELDVRHTIVSHSANGLLVKFRPR